MTDMADDDRLLAELGEAIRAANKVPAQFIAAGKAAFAWRTIDAELAALAHDSATEPHLSATRAEPAELRSLSFVARELSIEIEVTGDALLGQIVPAQPGQIEVRVADGSVRTIDIDEVGWFVIRPLPAGMFRLHLRVGNGATVVTEWVTL